MLTIVGTVAWDTMARVKRIADRETTGGVVELHPDLPGGTGGNVAVALARLGAASRLVSVVGEDFSGSSYESMLSASGVKLDGLRRSRTRTSRAYIFFDDAGQQVTYFYAGASRELVDTDLRPTGRVHFAAGEIAVYPRLMEGADWVSFDPGQEVFHRDLAELTACLPHVDLLFLNRKERDILEAEAGWTIERLFREGIEVVVETRGAGGCIVHTRKGHFAAPAVEAAMRDPTGAGDAHRAGFLYALERGAEIGVAARFASTLGGSAVEAVGAQAGLPTLAEAVARYEKAFGERPF